MTPLLSCQQPRIVEWQLELGQFEAAGPLLVLVGAWRPLFGLLTGQRRLDSGVLRIQGVDAEGAAARGIGVAPAGVRWPASWSVMELLTESARLLGESRRRGADGARAVAEELGLDDLLRRPLSALGPGQRRGVAIAIAALGAPRALALDDPFEGLEPSAEAYVVRLIERAVAARPVLLSVQSLPGDPERDTLPRAANELLFLGPSGLSARGTYSELMAGATTYRVSTPRSAGLLLSALAEAGYEVRRVMGADDTALMVTDASRLGTGPLFEASLAAGIPIIELRPVLDESRASAADSE